MAAPRLYSDAQREAVWRLHEAGLKSPEIAAACAEGRSGLARFEIPDRTVRDVIAKLGEEADRKLPTTVIELESAEAMERAPARAARLVEAELDRLEEKAAKRPLSDPEIDRLSKLTTHSERIRRLLNARAREGRRRSAKQRAGTERPKETAVERIAREREEREKAGAEPSHTRTRHDDGDPTAPQAQQAVSPPTDTPPTAPPSERDRRQEIVDAVREVAAAHGALTPELERVKAVAPEPEAPPKPEHSEDFEARVAELAKRMPRLNAECLVRSQLREDGQRA